jgi:hypothetical protein
MKVPAFGHLQEPLDGNGNEQQGWLCEFLRPATTAQDLPSDAPVYPAATGEARSCLPRSHRRGTIQNKAVEKCRAKNVKAKASLREDCVIERPHGLPTPIARFPCWSIESDRDGRSMEDRGVSSVHPSPGGDSYEQQTTTDFPVRRTEVRRANGFINPLHAGPTTRLTECVRSNQKKAKNSSIWMPRILRASRTNADAAFFS